MNTEEKAQIVYETEKALRLVLRLTIEVENEMGMCPAHIKIDGRQIPYQPTDARRVMHGTMTEAEYLEKYAI